MPSLSGQGLRSVAIVEGINSGQLYQWVNKYKTLGYNGLINKPKGRPSKDSKMKVPKNNILPRKLNESEYEELNSVYVLKLLILKLKPKS